ncbi:MAG: hypothetical protein AAGD06_19025 [Acidobacteriota bacterium]
MKKVLFTVACAALAIGFLAVPSQDVDAAEPCTWGATMTAVHATCGPVTFTPSGYSLAACNASIQWYYNMVATNDNYSNAQLVSGCRIISGNCPVQKEDDVFTLPF